MLEISPIIPGVIICYLVFVVANGFFQSWRQKKRSAEGFMLGGKTLGPWVLSMSEKASESSGYMTMGLPGEASTMGFSVSWAAVVSYFSLFNWFFMARPLRRITEIFNALTVTDYLEQRFKDQSHVIRMTGVVIMAFFEVVYVMVQYIALAKLFQMLLGMDYAPAVLMGVIITVSYTVTGGFTAVAINDFVQGIILFFGLGITPILMVFHLGGLETIGQQLTAMHGTNWLLPYFGDPSLSSIGTLVMILSYVMIGIGMVGSPHIIVRYMAAKNGRDIRRMAVIGSVWMAISYYGAISIGLMGTLVVPGLADPEQIMMAVAIKIFPPIIAGLIISASCAAIMSSVDSMLLIAASTIAEDYFNCVRNKGKLDGATVVKITRITTALLGALGACMALYPNDSIFWLAVFAWGGLASCFGPVIVISLYWRNVTRQGALAGMIVGPAVTIIWYLTLKGPTGIYEGGPGFIASLLVIWIVSLLTKKTGIPEIDEEWAIFTAKTPVGTPMPLPSDLADAKAALSNANMLNATQNDIVARLLRSDLVTATVCEA